MVPHLLALLVATIHAPTALAQDPDTPSLLFNWTLRPIDAPLDISISSWTAVDKTDPNTAFYLSSYGGTADVEYRGSGMAFLGEGSGWARTDSDGLPDPAGYAYVTNDPTFDSARERNIFAPATSSALWQRATPRFMKYDMQISAFYGNWTLRGAELMTGMNSSAASLAEVKTRTENFVNADGSLNSFYNRTGRWEVTPADEIGPLRTTCYDDAILRVDVPLGTAWMIMNGTRTRIGTSMYFKLYEGSATSYSRSISLDMQFGYSVEALFYFQLLDPNVKYILVVDCVFSSSLGQNTLSSMTFYEGTTNGSSSGTGGDTSGTGTSGGGSSTSTGSGGGGSAGNSANKGNKIATSTIVAIVASVVAFLAILLIIWMCRNMGMKRRKQLPPAPPPHGGIPAYQSTQIQGGEVDSTVYPTPYQYQQQQNPADVQNYYIKPGGNPTTEAPPTYAK